jgi:hypothetical protein
MSKTTLRNLIISISLLVISTAVLGFTFYKINTKQTLLGEQISTLAEQQGQENSFFRLQKIAEESAEDRANLQSYFLLRESDSIDFLNQVETLAPTLGVALETNGLVQLPETESGNNWIEVSFTYSGSRQNVNRFTNILEHVPYISYVTSYSVSADTPTNWEAEIKMLVYVLAYDS